MLLVRSSRTTSGKEREWQEGPIRGQRLHGSGHLVLHGSCVRIGHVGLTIVGSSGTGKSTLATLLCIRGARLISDGMTPVDPETLLVAPGPSRTKLNEESLRLLGQDPKRFELVHAESQKRYFPVRGLDQHGSTANVASIASADDREGFDNQEMTALKLVLLVEDAAENSIVPIAGAETLIGLIANVYLGSCLPPEHASILLQRASAIVQRGVQVLALRRKKDPSQLVAIAECIEKAACELG